MKNFRKFAKHVAIAIVGIAALSMTACSDDVDESNLYTFTGNMITG